MNVLEGKIQKAKEILMVKRPKSEKARKVLQKQIYLKIYFLTSFHRN